MPNYDPISALMSPVSGEDELRALADSLRKRKRAADFYSATTIKPLQQAGQQESQDILGTAERQGVLRQALAQRQSESEQAQATAAARANEGALNRAAALQRTLARGPTVMHQAAAAPTGYYYVDPLDPSKGLKATPGGPAEQKLNDKAAAEAVKTGSAREKWGHQIDVATEAQNLLGPLTTGPGGAVMSKIWGSEQTDLAGNLNTLTAELTFDRLQQMKDESPRQSSGLGQVSDREGRLLGQAVVSLQENQSAEKLRENLDYIKLHYNNFLDSLEGKLPSGYNKNGEFVGDEKPAESDYEKWKRENGKQ